MSGLNCLTEEQPNAKQRGQILPTETSMEKGDVVLVTGGAGFLGQHLVKLLHERAPNVKEIRVFDVKPYKQLLEFEAKKPLKEIVGDIRNKDDVRKALQGVDTVFHAAALISFGTHPDYNGMEEINVKGTKNILSACKEEGVSRLIYTSTIDVVVGHDDVIDGDETTPIPNRFLFPGYPDTKYKAECMVLAANEPESSKEAKLHTLVLRPNVMYGELDPFYITSALKRAAKAKGILQKVGTCDSKFQQAYAGNMAWGHLVAAEALKSKPEVASGQVYFLTDDTPLESTFDFVQQFLQLHDMKLSEKAAPFWLIYGLLYFAETVAVLLRPLVRINLPSEVCSLLYITNSYYYNRTKAEKVLGYSPLYSYDESMKLASKFYKSLDLDSA